MHCRHDVAICQYPPTACWDLLGFSLSPFWVIGDRETKVPFILYIKFILLYIYWSKFFPPQWQRMWALSICTLNLLRGTGRSGMALPPGGSEFLKTLISLFSMCPLFSHSPCLPPVLLYPLHPRLSKPQLTDIPAAPATPKHQSLLSGLPGNSRSCNTLDWSKSCFKCKDPKPGIMLLQTNVVLMQINTGKGKCFSSPSDAGSQLQLHLGMVYLGILCFPRWYCARRCMPSTWQDH